MNRIRNVALTCAAAALAVTALGAPAAAAAEGKMLVIQGNPGNRVDICVGNQEIRSRVPYGGRVSRTVPAGAKLLKFYKADPRRCRGTLLAKRWVKFPDGSDKTVVLTRKDTAPGKVVVFDNAGAGTTVSTSTQAIRVRSAADFPLDMKISGSSSGSPFTPSLLGGWIKGDEFRGGPSDYTDYFVVTLWVTKPAQTAIIAGPVTWTYDPAVPKRFEVYVLGSKPWNAKMILIARPAIF